MNTLTRTSIAPVVSAHLARRPVVTDWGWSRSSLAWRIERFSAEGTGLVVKRALDIAGAVAGLLLLMPVMLTIALLIRLESPGGALFSQWRRGHRGKAFRIFWPASLASPWRVAKS
jgi:lipopolysaccharide/colanic/teichoic acid biosynthesis glycosyltransferase